MKWTTIVTANKTNNAVNMSSIIGLASIASAFSAVVKSSNIDCSMISPPTIRKIAIDIGTRSEEHTSELQSRFDLVCRLLLEKQNHITHRCIQREMGSSSHSS